MHCDISAAATTEPKTLTKKKKKQPTFYLEINMNMKLKFSKERLEISVVKSGNISMIRLISGLGLNDGNKSSDRDEADDSSRC